MDEHTVSNHQLEGKIAIITGASRGIGFAIAHRLVAAGARVCMTARKPEPLREALEQFPKASAICVAGKSYDPDHRLEVLDTVQREYGRLDILVNNAGTNPVFGPLITLDLNAAHKIIEVNLLATLAWIQNACQHEGLGFVEDGCVINISSVSAQTPSPGIGFYGISKAAIDHLTRTLAVELGPKIRVNTIAHAVIKTEFARALYEGKEEKVAAHYPLGRLGSPEDVANVVAFLASPDSNWILGQIFNLDGGLLVAGGAT